MRNCNHISCCSVCIQLANGERTSVGASVFGKSSPVQTQAKLASLQNRMQKVSLCCYYEGCVIVNNKMAKNLFILTPSRTFTCNNSKRNKEVGKGNLTSRSFVSLYTNSCYAAVVCYPNKLTCTRMH